MDRLIANFTVSRVPNPMPFVVEPVLGKRLHRRRSCPQVVVHSGRNGFLRSVPNRWPPLVTNRARQIDVADRTVFQVANRLDHPGVRARLASMLTNPVVFL